MMNSARKTAFDILNSIEKNKSFSNLAIDAALEGATLSDKDSALVSNLVYGVLERRITLDYSLSRFLTQPLSKLKPQVLTALRLGTYQLLFTEKIPVSAAVNESVELVKKNGCAFASGLVNAVLRKIASSGMLLPDEGDKLTYLSVKYSFPKELVKLWIDSYGEENAVGIMSAASGRAPVSIRVNTLKTVTSELKKELLCDEVEAVESFLHDALLLPKCGSVEKLSAYKKGLFHVQDLSSQLCCKALNVRMNDRIFDFCAAPGGKSFTLAEMISDCGEIVAMDIYSHRLKLIDDRAHELGISCIKTLENDASVLNQSLGEADRILCDVPCSGLGVVRRKPEIRYKSLAELDKLPDLQYHILCSSSACLKVGGRLVYSTCALNPAENEEVCRRFLREHPDFKSVKPFDCDVKCSYDGDFATFMPHLSGTDGFFIAAFER